MASLSNQTMALIAAVVIVVIIIVIYVVKKKTPTATTSASACKVDTDCTSPQVCVSNACADPTTGGSTGSSTAASSTTSTTATADNGQACKANGDCTSGNCVNSVCAASAPTTAANGQPCKSAGDCTSGFCVSDVCAASAAPTTAADGQVCTADGDCTGGHCYYGVCTTSAGTCSTTTPCADASTHDCVNGACLVRPAAYGCSPGCAGGFVCDAGKCEQANWSTVCSSVTCPSGQVCNSAGNCVPTAAVYACKTNKDCIQPVGPDSVCNSQGFCSCNFDVVEEQNTACIGGTTYSTGCSGTAAYAGLYNALDGYTCTGYNYRCAGVVCPYGQSCTNGVCK